ncbi:MAG: hypothetical protein HY252_16675 [Sphingobacteriales bacterium]|nr:hypothetical protein [Sphingobacteriales bacterium]
MKPVIKRMKRATPKFFQKLRNIGLAVTAVSATIIGAPVALPAIIIKVAGYLAVAGAAVSGVSQTAVKNEKK